MATDFKTGVTNFPGGLIPGASDTPLDIRSRVETEADILSIPKPYIGMVVYVKDTGKRYEVLTLKDKKQGFTIIKNGAVDTYRELTLDTSNFATKEELNMTNDELDTAQTDIMSLEEALARLLNPYKAPIVAMSLVQSPEGSVFEKGDVVNITRLRAKVDKGSDDISKVSFYQGEEELAATPNGIFYDYEFNNAIQLQDSIDEGYYKVEVTDASNNIIGANAQAINFVYPYYFGVIDENAIIDGNTIKGLNKVIEIKKDQSYIYTSNNQHMVFAFPKAYGSLTQIVDANGFILTATFDVEEVDVECLDGTTQSYYVYKNGASTISNYNITFKI